MTEMIEPREAPALFHLIDPLAFVAALVLAPLAVTALTFWILFIPVFALIFGAPYYLATATPVLLWSLSRYEPNVSDIAALGFLTNLGVCALIYVFHLIEAPQQSGTLPMLYLIFGSIFAPIWAGAFAKLYLILRRPFFAQTV